jgi:hypothetical protein
MRRPSGNLLYLPARRTPPAVLFPVTVRYFAAMKQMLPALTFNWLKEREKTARPDAVSRFFSRCFTSMIKERSVYMMYKKAKNIKPISGGIDVIYP